MIGNLCLKTSWLTFTILGGLGNFLWAQNPDKISRSASWQWPSAVSYQTYLDSFLDQRQVTADVRLTVQRAFGEANANGLRGPELLDRLLDISGLVEPKLAELVGQFRSIESVLVPPKDIPWLTSDVPGWLQDSVRLACGRAYAQRRMYDEALETLAGLELGQVCDPATLLFYRASAEHHLLRKGECLASLKVLLEREEELPVRYRQLSLLMQADISPLKEDSLDEIARLMTDVQRRLDLGRAGQRVRDVEDDIVSKLDKLIDKIEEQAKQMQQQQQGQQGQQGQQPPNGQQQPMEESQIAGGAGPGDVDQKKLEERSGWGNLPPAQRKEALQRLTEELPTHYRDVIEGYFRQLAKDRS